MNTPKRKVTRGFTLIELLTVIAIIGILAAIIIPTVGAVRENARMTRCMSNLRQSTVAFLALVNENHGSYAGRSGGADPTFREWTIELEEKGFVGIKKSGNNLNAVDIYFCPLWMPEAGINTNNKWQTFGLNMMVGANAKRIMGGNPTITNELYRINYNSVATSSRFPLMADSYTSGNGEQIFRLRDNIASGGVHLRHKDKAHVSFLDGHVKKLDADGLAAVGFSRAWKGSVRPANEITLTPPAF